MQLSRRDALMLGVGAAAVVTFGAALPKPAMAAAKVEDIIAEFTGGKEAQSGKISLSTPEIAENGNTVPISFSVESPMTEADHVAAVLVLADGNPAPGVGTFNFTAMSGEATAKTRVRLAKTQNIIAVARMKDGSFYMDKKEVKVTIGGCGG